MDASPIVKDVLNLPFGEIRNIIIKVQHNCTSDRKRYGKMEDVHIKHEYCVIFKKPVVHPPQLLGVQGEIVAQCGRHGAV